MERGLKLGGSTYTIPDVFDALREGKMQSFAHNNALVITEIVQAPRKKYLNVFLVVGDDMADVMRTQPQVIAFAREHGCEWIQTYGRLGLQKVLPGYGWKPTHTLFVLEIENGKEQPTVAANDH